MHKTKNKLKIKVPHVFVILFVMIVIAAVSTYLVPSGIYDMMDGPGGRKMIDPNSYHAVEGNPTNAIDFLSAIPQGFEGSAMIIIFVLILSGAFEVLKTTGFIDTAIIKLAGKLSTKGSLVIPILMILFGTLAAFVGTPELSIVYVPTIAPLLLVLGYDTMTALGISLLSTCAGFAAALTNPFTVGISQQIAGLPLLSGIEYRAIIYLILLITSIIFVMSKAKKIKENPSLSITYERDMLTRKEIGDFKKISKNTEFTTQQVLAGVTFGVFIIILIYGVLNLGWYMKEMAGIFLAMGILAGFFGGLNTDKICNAFVKGGADVLVGALAIGIARGITIVMENANIMHTIINGLSYIISSLPSSITAAGMLVVQTLLNFLVPSGSGQALITMPILSPLADITGVNQQVAVLALQFGDGLSNVFYPTVGYLMATLAIVKVRWDEWVKYMSGIFVVWIVLSFIFVITGQLMNYGPF